MNQRGFIQLSLMAWAAVAAGTIILTLGVALKWQSSRLETCKTEFAVFKSNVELLGKKAKEAADKKAADDLRAKEKADVENQKLRANNALLAKRLLDARSRGGFLPIPTPSAKRPDILAFDRAELDGALRRLDVGVSSLVAEGDQARIDLDSARAWAASTLKP